MVKSMTSEDFVNYVKDLKFYDVSDVINFINTYKEAYIHADPSNKELLQQCYSRYIAVISIHGPIVLNFAQRIIDAMEIDDEFCQKVESLA